MEDALSEGKKQIERGDLSTALAVYQEGLKCDRPAGVNGAITEALLWLSCSMLYRHEKLWEVSLHHAIQAVSLHPSLIRGWIEVVIALCKLNLRCLAEEVRAEGCQALTLPDQTLLQRKTDRYLAAACDSSEFYMMGRVLKEQDPVSWLTVRLGAMLFSKAVGSCEALQNLRRLGCIISMVNHLDTIERSSLGNVRMIQKACRPVYILMTDAAVNCGLEGMKAFTQGTCLMEILKRSFNVPMEIFEEEERIRLHFSQLLLVEEMHRCSFWPVNETRTYLQVTQAQISQWLAFAEYSFTHARSSSYLLKALALKRLAVCLQSPSDFEEANAVSFTLQLLEECAVVRPERVHLGGCWEMIQVVQELVTLMCPEAEKIKLVASAAKGPKVFEPWIRVLAERYENQTYLPARYMGKGLIKDCLESIPRKALSKEAKEVLCHFCSGCCVPALQEKKPHEFELYYVSGRRTKFCSSECYLKTIGARNSTRSSIQRAVSAWELGRRLLHEADKDKLCEGLKHLAEAMTFNLFLPRVPEESFTEVQVKAARMLKQGKHGAVHSFVLASLSLRSLLQKANESFAADERQEQSEDKDFYDMLASFDEIGRFPDLSPMKMLSIFSEVLFKNHSLSPADMRPPEHASTSTSSTDSVLKPHIGVLKLQGILMLQLLWKDDHIYQYVVDYLSSAHTSLLYQTSSGLHILGQMFAFLCLLGELRDCQECMKTGAQGWLASWSRMETLADSEEPFFSVVLRWLAHSRTDATDLLAAADVAERRAKELWGDEEQKERKRVYPRLTWYCEKFPYNFLKNAAQDRCARCFTPKNSEGPAVQFKFCKGCHRVAYCSEDCRKAHRKAHVIWCTKLPDPTDKEERKKKLGILDEIRGMHPHFHDRFLFDVQEVE